LKKLKEFANFFVFIGNTTADTFSLLTFAIVGCVHHQAMTYCIHFVKAKNFTDHNKGFVTL
jgi:hypothetical protein